MPLVAVPSPVTTSLLNTQTGQALTQTASSATQTPQKTLSQDFTRSLLDCLGFESADNVETETDHEQVNQHLSSLTEQLLAQINGQQGQNGGSGGQQNQQNADQDATSGVLETTANGNSSAAANNDLSTVASYSAFDENRNKWNQAASGGDYSYTVVRRDQSGADSGQVAVSVSNGQVSSISSGGALDSAPTIEQMFADIQAAQANGERVDVLYDPRLGFPAFVLFGNDRADVSDNVSYIYSHVTIA